MKSGEGERLRRRLERGLAGASPELATRARRFRAVRDVPLEELRAHPDLGERLEEALRGVAGAEIGVWCGVFAARAAGGAVFALAEGTSTLRFRLGLAEASAVAPGGASSDPELGPDWVTVDAWCAERPAAEWRGALAVLAARAAERAREGRP